MRDRLIELILKSDILCTTCGESSNTYCAEAIADLIIADDWFRPPCKVGDVVYAVDRGSELWWCGKLISMYYTKADMRFAVAFEDGEVVIYDADCVFLTKEEAKQALKERGRQA